MASTRREFLKNLLSLSAIPIVLSLGKTAFGQTKKKKGGAVDPKTCDAVPGKDGAGTIKYVTDKSKVAKTDQVVKGGIPFAKQDCANCILYRDGVCSLITSGCAKVHNNGWCPSWTHNPAVPV